MNIRYIVLLFTFLLVMNSCNKENRPEKLTLKIVQTSDVHGALFPFDYIKNKTTDFSLAQVHALVSELRLNPEYEVILLDNGDILQGQPTVYYSNFEDINSEHICASVMNYMQYDAATVGNHDIEAGHPVYDKLNKEFKFPWLAANAILKQENHISKLIL